MRKLIYLTIVMVLVACAAGVAVESEEITWCETPEEPEATEATMVEETCLGGPNAYEMCVYEMEEMYNYCMNDYRLWAYSSCGANWQELYTLGVCFGNCGSDPFCLDDCLYGTFEYNYFMFYCVQPLIWQGHLACSSMLENFVDMCCYGVNE